MKTEVRRILIGVLAAIIIMYYGEYVGLGWLADHIFDLPEGEQ